MLAFKVEAQEPTGSGGGTKWTTIHEKQKIQEVTVHGSFDPPPQSAGGNSALVRFNFNREFLSRAVDYDLSWEPAELSSLPRAWRRAATAGC